MNQDVTETFEQLKEKLLGVYTRGKAWRVEVGTLLLKLRKLAAYGQWKHMLTELGLKNSTAKDYMAEARKETAGFRPFPQAVSPEALALFPPADDPEALEIETAIANAIAEVEAISGRPPRATRSSHKNRTRDRIVLGNHVCIRPTLYVAGDEKDWYDAAWQTKRDHVHNILVAALREAMAADLVDAGVAQ
jgi:hypothetical protein